MPHPFDRSAAGVQPGDRVVVERARRGYADRMVLAHDASCFIDYFPDPAARSAFQQAQPNWNSTPISNDVLPTLRERGMSDGQLRQMLVETPRRYVE